MSDDVEAREEARALLVASGLFFSNDEDELPDGLWLNLNDAWAWACADTEKVTDENIVEVARLFRDYGWCGLLYWASGRRQNSYTCFKDNNRFIEFVRREEEIRKSIPDSNRRATYAAQYTVGEER